MPSFKQYLKEVKDPDLFAAPRLSKFQKGDLVKPKYDIYIFTDFGNEQQDITGAIVKVIRASYSMVDECWIYRLRYTYTNSNNRKMEEDVFDDRTNSAWFKEMDLEKASSTLKEEYYDSFKLENDTIEIWKNPIKSETNFSTMARGIIYKDDLYAWDGRERALHKDVAKHLKLDLTDPNIICIYLRTGNGKESNKEVEVSFLNTKRYMPEDEVSKTINTVVKNKNVIKYMGKKFNIYRENLGI